MSSLPPRPPNAEAQSIPKNINRLAKRDPQLYPLAAVIGLTVLGAGWFLTSKPSGADRGDVAPMMPSRLKDEVNKQKAENAAKQGR